MGENLSFSELLEVVEREKDAENALIITKTSEGRIDIFYNDMNGLEVLGMIEAGKSVALDVVFED
ncbi:hypothetical protein ACUW9Z_000891 [Aerococcus sp. 150760007-1]|uniref:Uncharacterized protein n=1 Tax=Aerococcus urinaeequi TaxID=51665 RepID=A0ABR5ZXV8_9LACT|nr:hypothetical protein [Aerococcus urinaeequi]MBA5746577.1 hypothetical protein [Aerococcus urinaeequi]MBA5829372.1 hypothetical protein [Aerococcus urinaeequi]MBA5860265.1 hypothetical protein [Aerococcus urinaeequi]